MDNLEEIIRLIADNPDIWKDYKRFKALLMDYIPQDKVRRNLILISIEERIPDEVFDSNKLSIIDVSRLERKLINASGCRNDIAKEIIDIWISSVKSIRGNNASYNLFSIPLKETNISATSQLSLEWGGITEVGGLYNKTYSEIKKIIEKSNPSDLMVLDCILSDYDIQLCSDAALDNRIEIQDISENLKQCLGKNGISTIGELRNKQVEEIVEIVGFSKEKYEELFLLLKKYNLIFHMYSPNRICYLDSLFNANDLLNNKDFSAYIETMNKAISFGFNEGYYHIGKTLMSLTEETNCDEAEIEIKGIDIYEAEEKGLGYYEKYYNAFRNWELNYYDFEKMIEVCFILGEYKMMDPYKENDERIKNTIELWNDAIIYAYSCDNPDHPVFLADYLMSIGKISLHGLSGYLDGKRVHEEDPLIDKERARCAFSIAFNYGLEEAYDLMSDIDESMAITNVITDISEWKYELLDDGSAKITGYTGNKYTISIPELIEGNIVTTIGSGIFRENSNNVLGIKVILPNTIKSIEAFAFEPNWDIFWKKELYKFDLKEINIPSSLEHIGWGAFIKSSLNMITIGKSVKNIEEGAFAGCWDLDIEVDKENESYSSRQGTLYDKTKRVLLYYSFKKKSIDIPKSIRRIGDSVFASYWLRKGKRIERPICIPDHVQEIGDYCFDGHIGEIKLSNNLRGIGKYAFNELSEIDTLVIPGSIKEISDLNSLFGGDHPYNEYGLSLVIKEGVKRIVLGDKELAAKMPDKLISITSRQFRRISIPDSVEHIEGGEYTFIMSHAVLCNEGSYAYNYFVREDVWTPRLYTGKPDWIEPEEYISEEFFDLRYLIPRNWDKELEDDDCIVYYPFDNSGWIQFLSHGKEGKIIDSAEVYEDVTTSFINDETKDWVESEEITISDIKSRRITLRAFEDREHRKACVDPVNVHMDLFVVNDRVYSICFCEKGSIDWRFKYYEEEILKSIKVNT